MELQSADVRDKLPGNLNVSIPKRDLVELQFHPRLQYDRQLLFQSLRGI